MNDISYPIRLDKYEAKDPQINDALRKVQAEIYWGSLGDSSPLLEESSFFQLARVCRERKSLLRQVLKEVLESPLCNIEFAKHNARETARQCGIPIAA